MSPPAAVVPHCGPRYQLGRRHRRTIWRRLLSPLGHWS